MQLGDLNRPVTIESATLTTDANGQEIKTWATLATAWARMVYQFGDETAEADQRVALRTVLWTIRYRSDVDETCRVKYNGKYFNITGIDRRHRKRYLILKTQYADRES